MHCRQEKLDLALLAGQDLKDSARREELRRHMADCPGCRVHFQRLKGTLQAFEKSSAGHTYERGDSLWPTVAARLKYPVRPSSQSATFNGWLPFVAMTAACVVMAAVVFLDQGTQPADHHRPPMSSNVFSPVSAWPGLVEQPDKQSDTLSDTLEPVRKTDRPATAASVETL